MSELTAIEKRLDRLEDKFDASKDKTADNIAKIYTAIALVRQSLEGLDDLPDKLDSLKEGLSKKGAMTWGGIGSGGFIAAWELAKNVLG